MKRLYVFLSIAAALIGTPVMAEQRHIPKAQLEEMFTNIKAKTSWDISGKMLWGYFFTGPNKAELETLGVQLVNNQYRLVELRKASPGWQLHVERVEAQTVDSLDARNVELEGLASQYKKVIYDGMDVGPAAESRE